MSKRSRRQRKVRMLASRERRIRRRFMEKFWRDYILPRDQEVRSMELDGVFVVRMWDAPSRQWIHVDPVGAKPCS